MCQIYVFITMCQVMAKFKLFWKKKLEKNCLLQKNEKKKIKWKINNHSLIKFCYITFSYTNSSEKNTYKLTHTCIHVYVPMILNITLLCCICLYSCSSSCFFFWLKVQNIDSVSFPQTNKIVKNIVQKRRDNFYDTHKYTYTHTSPQRSFRHSETTTLLLHSAPFFKSYL